jgi:hypothetical protein
MSWFLVQQPMHILGVASVYFIVWTVLRFGKIRKARHANAILVPAVFCLVYAAWEWLVLIKSPEADIRFDLLLIWPIQAILTIWALVRTFRL